MTPTESITMEEKLERMYRKVSGGKRSGPNLELMPTPVKDQQGRDRYIDLDNERRRVFPSRPAIWLNNGQAAYATFSNRQPNPEFWGDLKEISYASDLDTHGDNQHCDLGNQRSGEADAGGQHHALA